MFQEVRQVPEERTRSRGHKLWEFIELLDPVSQKQTWRRLFLNQGFVRKVLLEKPGREQGKCCKEGKRARMQCPVKSRSAWG